MSNGTYLIVMNLSPQYILSDHELSAIEFSIILFQSIVLQDVNIFQVRGGGG